MLAFVFGVLAVLFDTGLAVGFEALRAHSRRGIRSCRVRIRAFAHKFLPHLMLLANLLLHRAPLRLQHLLHLPQRHPPMPLVQPHLVYLLHAPLAKVLLTILTILHPLPLITSTTLHWFILVKVVEDGVERDIGLEVLFGDEGFLAVGVGALGEFVGFGVAGGAEEELAAFEEGGRGGGGEAELAGEG